METLKNKRVVITGGNSGLGKAMAELLTNAGAKVLITGRNETTLKQVAEKLNCSYLKADVSKDEDIIATYDWVDKHFDGLDILINNAGVGAWSKIDELERSQIQAVFEINVFGAAMMAKEAAKRFKKMNSGDIVNIASTASIKGYASGSIYSASKFALRSMSQAWQAELRPFNVRVIQINPSEVPTAFGKEDREERDLVANRLTPREIADVIKCALEMDRRGFIPEVSIFATNPF